MLSLQAPAGRTLEITLQPVSQEDCPSRSPLELSLPRWNWKWSDPRTGASKDIKLGVHDDEIVIGLLPALTFILGGPQALEARRRRPIPGASANTRADWTSIDEPRSL